MSETRQERFKRLAIKRTNAVLEKLRLLGNLSNKANYDYSDFEIKKIFGAIENQLRTAKAKFNLSKNSEFRLKR